MTGEAPLEPDHLLESLAPAPGPSHRIVFGIVAIALFMGAVDLTIVATALPAIHRSLGASINWVGWTITIYGLSVVIVLPIAGRISTRYGRKRVFLFGIATFTVASLLCGFATDIYMLIAFRAVQAVGGGALQPSAAGLITDHLGRDRDRGDRAVRHDQRGRTGRGADPRRRPGRLPVLAVDLLRQHPGRGRAVRADPPIHPRVTNGRGRSPRLRRGLPLRLGQSHRHPGDHHHRRRSVRGRRGRVRLLEGAAIALVSLFVRHTRRSTAPFVPLWLLTGKGFAAMNGLNLLQGFVTFGVASLVPLYAEQRYHLTALSAGGLLTARALGAIVIGVFAVFALRRTGYRLPIFVGFSVIAMGTLLMSVAPRWGVSPFVWLSVCVGIIGLGLGTVNPAASNACMRLAPDQAAAITGLRSMFLNLGVIFCVSITTAILNRSGDPGITQAHVFWAVTALIVLIMPVLVARGPGAPGPLVGGAGGDRRPTGLSVGLVPPMGTAQS